MSIPQYRMASYIEGPEMIACETGDYVLTINHLAVVERLKGLLREWRETKINASDFCCDLLKRTDKELGNE
jgi:hypothetical protein